jgi:aspartyl-tRNA(Asn)/glutamyl-tRNA(Gln) amidotransferase subunit B
MGRSPRGHPMAEYESVIGLETHIQLNTRSKIFCGCKADFWHQLPNENICPVCTGLPGVLPVLNRSAVEKAVVLAAAMHADSIQPESYLARKNYFYPDLPKGYQISQYDEPLARGGSITIPMPDGGLRKVSIQKTHIEEDAGKTVHRDGRRLIDFNRCGVPLVEMVSGPDLRSADEAAQYVIRLRQLVRWLGISDGDMERGHIRCDANVSIRLTGEQGLNPKTEIKNLNSIEAVRAAIQSEVERQVAAVEAGKTVEAWTLNWDGDSQTLHKMRAKETEADYRYFREPDLLPIRLDQAWLEGILAGLPELPLERRARFMAEYALPAYDAEILTDDRSLADFFERAVEAYGGEPKVISNWVMNDVLRMIRERGAPAVELRMKPRDLAEIVHMLDRHAITSTTAKQVLEDVEKTGQPPKEIVEAGGLSQVSDEEILRSIAREIIAESPEQVATYRGGKVTVLGWFVGQIMRKTGGKANARLARSILEELLSE